MGLALDAPKVFFSPNSLRASTEDLRLAGLKADLAAGPLKEGLKGAPVVMEPRRGDQDTK